VKNNPSILTRCGIIVLAAGSSSRLGKPKQLLEYKGGSLVQFAAGEAIRSCIGPVIVVLGAEAANIKQQLTRQQLHVIENPEWKEGMASSIRCGLTSLQEIDSVCDAAILMVCDQPYVSASLLNELVARQKETGKLIITSDYGKNIGPPALFHQQVFQELLQLKGDAGARSVVKNHSNDMATVLFPRGIVDIDTTDDYKSLNKNE
jgi:molybdenum cofactor cytidylyltransferase